MNRIIVPEQKIIIPKPKAPIRLGLGTKSIWHLECWRNGRQIWDNIFRNTGTDEGLTLMLNNLLHGTAGVSPWYCVLFENDYTVLGTETYASPGYTEFTAYDEATRPEYTEAEAAAKYTSNLASKASFTANDSKTLYGGALVSYNVKGDTAEAGAKMLCLGKFDVGKPAQDDDVLKLWIEFTSGNIV